MSEQASKGVTVQVLNKMRTLSRPWVDPPQSHSTGGHSLAILLAGQSTANYACFARLAPLATLAVVKIVSPTATAGQPPSSPHCAVTTGCLYSPDRFQRTLQRLQLVRIRPSQNPTCRGWSGKFKGCVHSPYHPPSGRPADAWSNMCTQTCCPLVSVSKLKF